MLQIANILSGTHRSNHIPDHGMQRTETRSINKQVKGKAIPVQSQIYALILKFLLSSFLNIYLLSTL